MKFVRCFAYGLEEGETITAVIEGQEVSFSHSAPQVDIELSEEEESSDGE